MLNLSANGSTVAKQDTRVTFLDEFRMMVFAPDVPEFTLFDMLVLRGHPANSRRFRIPLRYHDWFPSVYVDSDRCLGTLDRDEPFTTDPTQAVFVMKLVSHRGPCVLLIVRIQTLIEHVCSMTPDASVPWDMWGRGVAVMELPARSDLFPLVQGVHVILAKLYSPPGADRHYTNLHIFDFNRRGWSTLPPWSEGDGTERMVLLEGGRDVLLRGTEITFGWGFHSLGDGSIVYLVSRFRRRKSDGRLTSW